MHLRPPRKTQTSHYTQNESKHYTQRIGNRLKTPKNWFLNPRRTLCYPIDSRFLLKKSRFYREKIVIFTKEKSSMFTPIFADNIAEEIISRYRRYIVDICNTVAYTA